jgi:hypothetical protein
MTTMTNNVGPDASQHLHDNVPIVAITWVLQNDCTSNVKLATLANVCKNWRDLCRNAVVSEAISSAGLGIIISDPSLLGSEPALSVVKESEVDVGLPVNNTKSLTLERHETLRNLLLIDMATELVLSQQGGIKSQTKQFSNTDGDFCLAWFAPSGIQITAVSLDDDYDDSDEFRFDFSGQAGSNEINGQTQKQQLQPRRRNTNSVSCCHEWRGYRHATEVLTPFGFATSFIMVRTDVGSVHHFLLHLFHR